MALSGTPLAVLGAFRSGTSTLSTLLVRMGVFFGADRELYGANQFNPGGHWELHDMQMLNTDILVAFGMNYYSGQTLPENWQELPASPRMVAAIRGLLTKHFAGRRLWGWKEPGASGLIPLYKEALAGEGIEARYAICVRHPLSVVASMRSRISGVPKTDPGVGPTAHSRIDQRMMGVWLYYTLACLKETIGSRRLVVAYESLLQDPRTYVDRLAQYLLESTPTQEQAREAAASIRPEWSHTRFTREHLEDWPPIVSRAYEITLEVEADPKGLNEGKYDRAVDALWADWKNCREVYRPTELPQSSFRFAQAAGPWSETKSYTPTRGWQAISTAVNGEPGTVIQLDPYDRPCQVWIRRAAWQTDRGERPLQLKPTANGHFDQAYGMTLVTAFGPFPISAVMPAGSGDVSLEIEFLVMRDRNVELNLIDALGRRLQTR